MEKYDYLNFRHNSHLINNEQVYFSCQITKFNDDNIRQTRTFVLTNQAIYNFKKEQIRRRIPIEKLEAITISLSSFEFILHFKEESDYRYLSYDMRNDIIETIFFILFNVRSLATLFPLYEVKNINLNTLYTTKEDIAKKNIIRPKQEFMKMVNMEKYHKDKQEKEIRSTTNRKSTTQLFQKDQNIKDMCIDDFVLLKLLGKGAFGKVLLACKKDTHQFYAIKILNKKHLIEKKQVQHTLTEKTILQHVNHPFIVGLNYAFQTPTKIYFVIDFMKGGELFTHIRSQKYFPEKQAKFYAACISLGLGHLHNKNYIYRDLKLENVLLDENGYALITDFGLAKYLKDDELAITFCGTSEYLAPELILGKGLKFTADWWSLGVLLYEMLYGIPPFYSGNVQSMYRKIINEPVLFRSSIQTSMHAKDIVLKLLTKDPTKRLGAKNDSLEILSHPWFAEYDIEQLLNKQLEAPYVPDTVNWENNFDEEFISEKIRKSTANIQMGPEYFKELEQFRHEFNQMNYNKDEHK